LSILGGIQPGPLSAYLSAAQRGGAGDDGLVQRLQLTVWPDAPNTWRNVDRWPNTAAKDAAWQVFDRLENVDTEALGAQQDEGDSISWLRFDQEAQAEFNQWRGQLENRLRTADMHPALESHLAKYRSLVPSLALLIHLADNPSGGAVGIDPLLKACAWAEYLESHAKRLYGQAIEPGIPAAVQLLKRLPELDNPFRARDVYRKGWRSLDREGTNAALIELCDRDYVREEQAASGGRTATIYHINPAIREVA
jgi:putative DNA primase/helicase